MKQRMKISAFKTLNFKVLIKKRIDIFDIKYVLENGNIAIPLSKISSIYKKSYNTFVLLSTIIISEIGFNLINNKFYKKN